MSQAVPSSASEIATVMTAAMDIVRLRRRPMPISEKTNCARMVSLPVVRPRPAS